MFKITNGKGFQMTFANGWTVSVQFGPGNYCDNRHASFSEDSQVGRAGSTTAEIAAWDKDGNWHDFGSDEVKGYCTADEVAQFITLISSK